MSESKCDCEAEKESRKLYTEQLKNAVALTTNQEKIVWTVFGVFLASQGVVVSGIVRNGGPLNGPLASFFLSICGFGLSIVWFLIQKRAIGHLKRYEELVFNIEMRLKVESNLPISPQRNKQAFDSHLGAGIRVREVMPAVSMVLIFVWVFVTLGCLMIWGG